MVSGSVSILLLAAAVVLIVLATGKWKVNAFVVLIVVAFAYGLAIGMPALDVVKTIRDGFGGTLAYIGIVIVAGTIMGYILEKTGAALVMTRSILSLVGRSRAPLAMNIAGYVVSIPVFCDSGYVILTPLNKALAAETKTSMGVMAVALATGLYATHTMVPPTPGPLAAAATLNADLGMVILYGLIVSIPASLAGLAWALVLGRKYDISPGVEETSDEVVAQHLILPSAFMSFLPLVLPIVLILLKSIAAYPTHPFGTGDLATFIAFVGDPVTALMLGVIASLFLVPRRHLSLAVDSWMGQGIKDAAIILAITGAGGAFGKVLGASPMKDFISTNMGDLRLGLFLPFAISAALKTAQGSSTVAIITTAAIMAPLLGPLGLDPAITTIVIGAGAMVVSHANDSYFWVVSQFSNMPVAVAYKLYTTATLVVGLVAFGAAWLLSLALAAM
ncbi:putative D-glycerate transporter protein [Rhodovulum sp. PH10]|uniref:GntP family permease n=1 Tax=Rhodovulum sp. PH10 TaxID=1187851 RepID=UPI00027C272D|nr:GntP family permease [Rhodovulum sp. PH10]EJW13446.1 putative D-glycerate transporter protein [Rhodovulum sp. PH10]